MPDRVKLDPTFHVPEEDPDIHLRRLLPRDLDQPFYQTIAQSLADVIHPRKSPPLVLTSKPVDPSELKGLNGLYSGNETRAGFGSLLIHAVAVVLLLFIGSIAPVQLAIKQVVTLIAPPVPLKPVENKAGGSGAPRAQVKPADPPRSAPRRFTPPPVEGYQTKLEAPATLVADLPDASSANLGDLTGLASLTGSGYSGGIGNRPGPGSGDGRGSGKGRGSGAGDGSGTGTGTVYRPGGGVSTPVPIFSPQPEYSARARQRMLQGTVMVSVVVDPNGNPENPEVVSSLGWGLDEKAIEDVLQWRFMPGKKDGRPVPVQVRIAVSFHLVL